MATLPYASPDSRISQRPRVLRHPYTLIAILILVGFGAELVGKKGSIWNDLDVRAAQYLLQGRDFYDLKLFTYPPFYALFHVPFVPLDHVSSRLARGAWFAILALSLVYLWRKSWRLAGGGRLEPDGGAPRAPWADHAAAILGHLCVLQFALNALTHLQTDLLIGALLMAGCGAIAGRRFYRAATWIGLAAAFKLTPLLFAPYFLYRRKPLAAGWLVLVTLAANLAPNLIHPPPAGGTWANEWYHMYLRPMAGSNYMPGDWKNQLDNNQAIAGAANRWLATTWRVQKGDFRVFDCPGRPPARTVRRAFYAMCLLSLVPVAWAVWKARRRPKTGADVLLPDGSAAPTRVMLECGIVLLLMLLFSPNSSRAHFCVMYLPAFCLARIATRGGTTSIRVLLALAMVASTLSIHIRIGPTKAGEQLLLWVGVVMFSAVFLLVGSAVAIVREGRE